MFPRWAPGGDVLYTSFLPETPQLYVGGRRITNDERQYRGAEFSPDGKVIVASVDMEGQSDLVLIDPQTGEQKKRLTETEWDEVSATWSRNGATIAFVSNKSGHPQIYLMNPDGSNERRLTMVGQYNTSPRFGPGNVLAFAGMDGYTSDIFTIDTSGSMNRLTQDQGKNKDPAWSQDGRYLVFLSDRNGGWRVWIMTEDGRYQFPITEGAGWYSTPDWGR
jgi:TolB protein